MIANPQRDRGSASVWVLACCGLLLLIGTAGVLRTEAVLGRHRAEGAADLAALAAAGQIGVSEAVCSAARTVAAANSATVTECAVDLAEDGRSGTVRVRVTMAVRLPVIGTRAVTASARAGRDRPGTPVAARRQEVLWLEQGGTAELAEKPAREQVSR